MQSPEELVIKALNTRLTLMREVSTRNKETFKEAGDVAGVEYYRGECSGLRMAQAVLQELIKYYEEKYQCGNTSRYL